MLVSRQVSSNSVNVWNFAPVSGGLRCMWVIESVLGHHPGLKMFFSLTWMASLKPLSNQRSSLFSTHTWLSSKECPLSFKCRCTAESCPEEVACLCHMFMDGLFSFPNLQFIAFFCPFSGVVTANHCFPFYPILCIFYYDTSYLHVLLYCIHTSPLWPTSWPPTW